MSFLCDMVRSLQTEIRNARAQHVLYAMVCSVINGEQQKARMTLETCVISTRTGDGNGEGLTICQRAGAKGKQMRVGGREGEFASKCWKHL